MTRLRKTCRKKHVRGLTLVELMAATTVTVMIAGGILALTTAAQLSNQAIYGRSVTMQHGRVVVERIKQKIFTAATSESFPGLAVFSESLGGFTYPDTLVVWAPDGTPTNPAQPTINELAIYMLNPAAPNELLEVTDPTDTRPAPALSDTAGWNALLDTYRQGNAGQRVVLTHLLRTAIPTDVGGNPLSARGVVRFTAEVRPSIAEIDEFRVGLRNWEDISWAQSLYGSNFGVRQVRCAIELQLQPAEVNDTSQEAAIPFFGSAAAYYEIQK